MKIRSMIVTLSAIMITILSGCGSQELQDHFEAGRAGVSYEEYTESKSSEKPTEQDEEEKESTSEEPETDDLSGVLYTDDFKKAPYKDYVSDESGSGKEGDLIYVRGEITGVEEDQNCLSLTASDGEWIVDCGNGGNDGFKKMLKSLKGEETRIFGTFDGYSKAWSKPVITIAKGSPDHACRIESTDGDIVVTYLDSKWKDKEADTDYSLGDLSWKGISEWEADNSFDDTSDPVTGTVLYGPLSGYPATVYVHIESLPEGMAGWDDSKADSIMDSLEDSYFEGAKILEKKDTKVAGLDARRVRCMIPFEDEGYSMDNVVYIIPDKEYYYAVSFGEPYFIGTKMSEYEDDLIDSIKYAESSADSEKKTDGKEEDKGNKTTKEDSAEKNDNKKSDNDIKNNAVKDVKDQADTPKTGVPSKSEIMSRAFTQHIDMNILTNGEIVPEKDDYTNVTFSADEMSGYDESTGECMYWADGIGYSIKFSYNSKGKITYSGMISGSDDEASFSGSTSGHEM